MQTFGKVLGYECNFSKALVLNNEGTLGFHLTVVRTSNLPEDNCFILEEQTTNMKQSVLEKKQSVNLGQGLMKRIKSSSSLGSKKPEYLGFPVNRPTTSPPSSRQQLYVGGTNYSKLL